ncbi:unnamed protein product [marine sediment metagenome]|uniref:Uncharacterized protein n=1 Tax=marine sediment metagenome TaxID=412755 RepID=X0U026_9ZZZZ
MLQVEEFECQTLYALKEAQNAWFKDMAKIHGEKFKIIEFVPMPGNKWAMLIYYTTS